MRGHLLVDSSTNSFGCSLNTSPLNKSPSTRPQVSRTRHAPSDVPSASKMKQRISEAFGSSKNVIYSYQDPISGVPETSIVPLRSSSLLTAPAPAARSLLSSSPSKAAARRRRRSRIPSSLPPSSPPSSGIDETEEPAFHLHRHSTRNLEPEDPLFGLLRGNQIFSRLRRHHPPQKIVGGPPSALGRLENLSPITPCAYTSTNVSSGRASDPFTFSRVGRTCRGDRDEGGQQENCPDPGASEGDSETLSGLLARLPRARRQPKRQRQRQDCRATSTSVDVSTTIEPPDKTAVEKERGKQRRKKRAGNEASHLKGEDRVVRNTVHNFSSNP